MTETPDDKLLDDLDLTLLDEAERRLDEVAIVTKLKAPELLNLFNYGHLTAQKARARFSQRLTAVTIAQEALAADIALNKAPEILKAKGLATARSPGGSEDLRKNVIAADPEYQAISRRVNDLKNGLDLFTIRARACERAFSAVKAIYGERDLPNPNLAGGGETRRGSPPASVPDEGAPTGFDSRFT